MAYFNSCSCFFNLFSFLSHLTHAHAILLYSIANLCSLVSDLRPLFSTSELFHRCLPRLINAFTFQNFPDCHPDDLDVQPQRPVIKIPNIQFEFLFPCNGISPIHLRPAGNTRLHLVAPHLEFLKKISVMSPEFLRNSKYFPIFFVPEYLALFIPPTGHMIKSIWVLDS